MNHRSSAQINSEIVNFGPAVFKAICDDLLENGTVADTERQHEANKVRLQAACDDVIARAEFDLKKDHRALWQEIWPRIVYAGTRSSKATEEINSMRALVPMFQDLDHFSPERYVFNEIEWQAFSKRSKNRLRANPKKDDGLSKSLADPHVSSAAELTRTTPEVWKILTKDPETYPGLRFSTMIPKIKKYLNVATHLHKDRAAGNELPLNYYTERQQFNAAHQFGQAWVVERKALDQVRKRFENQVGPLTALHTMMDMGLKTIKPDRVMTYLFSQLGWLQTLPASWTQQKVIREYRREPVIREMTVRADVFAASLDRAGLSRAHRRLDIWFVKFGQEPDQTFGLTVNLQRQSPGIRSVFDRVRQAAAPQGWQITVEEAAKNWPTEEFSEVVSRPDRASTKAETSARTKREPGRSRSPICMSRKDAESLFVHTWKAGFLSHPDIYPSGKTGISNENKEMILCKIERCEDPHMAFVGVLQNNHPTGSH